MATVMAGGNNVGTLPPTACPLPATTRSPSAPLPRPPLVGLRTRRVLPQIARSQRPPTQAPALDLAWLASPGVILATDVSVYSLLGRLTSWTTRG
jgi:hypothetical protein